MGSIGALTTLNFLMADVRDGLGPYLAIFLQGQHWSPVDIGLVLTIGGLAGMIATTPMGAFVDATHRKRLVTIGAGLAVTAACLAIYLFPNFWIVSLSQVLTGAVGAVIPPAIAAITLGVVGPAGFSHQIGRNEAANHGGNVVAAVACAGFSYLVGIQAVFFVMIAMAVGSIAATLAIRESDIDHDIARGLDSAAGTDHAKSGLAVLLKTPSLLVLGLILMLFHFGNAAMLPLVGQRIEALQLGNAVFWTSVAVIVAQAVMVPMALLAARIAERVGYAPLLIAALIALPVRSIVAASTPHAWIAIPVQMLDGVGAGILGVVTPALVARILRGTGRFNVGLGAVMTVQGVGAAISPWAAGNMIQYGQDWLATLGLAPNLSGYGVAFLGLGLSAVVALALFFATMRLLPLEREGGHVRGRPAEAPALA
ncbi:MFS transporter [Chelatococcus sambhunathii]|uniref:MFS transporter n=1 Tax=Chelatococcus sambhunathii TaxID=363953 RepID=A0ABU1DH48_9HYPH|nr:MFS transporter [Chelatococcus sambhunathii]MDR4307448.1 MFS transporter [Chelatococcus sambhunathii]